MQSGVTGFSPDVIGLVAEVRALGTLEDVDPEVLNEYQRRIDDLLVRSRESFDSNLGTLRSYVENLGTSGEN